MPDNRTARILWFLLLLGISAIVFHSSLTSLIRLSLGDDRYSYVSLIPVMTAVLIFLKRKTIFVNVRYSPALGIPLMTTGALLSYGLRAVPGVVPENYRLSIVSLGIVLIWIAAFALIFGAHAAAVAGFPLGLLLLTAPVPGPALNHLISALQYTSAFLSTLLFKVLRVPALRQGLIISLPGFDIEIAEQCSGIRSTVSLVLACALGAYAFLGSTTKRLLFVLAVLPVVVLKNTLRIVTLSSLALYVDRGFLFGNLHRYGGLCFSLIDLGIVIPLLLWLHKSEVDYVRKMSSSAFIVS
jgi:exosortase